METGFGAWAFAIVTGIVSAFLTSAISRGFGLTRVSWAARRAAVDAEQQEWLTGGSEARQRITEAFILRIAATFFAANAAWVLPEIFLNVAYAKDVAGQASSSLYMGTYLFSVCLNTVAAVFFLYGFAVILRYSRLRALAPADVVPSSDMRPEAATSEA